MAHAALVRIQPERRASVRDCPHLIPPTWAAAVLEAAPFKGRWRYCCTPWRGLVEDLVRRPSFFAFPTTSEDQGGSNYLS